MSDQPPTCGHPNSDHAPLCPRCVRALEKLIGDVPALDGHLEVSYIRAGRHGERVGARATDSTLSFNPKASKVAAQLRHAVRAAAVGVAQAQTTTSEGEGTDRTGRDAHRAANVVPADLRERLLHELAERNRARARAINDPKAPTAGLARFLLANIHHLARHPAAETHRRRITDAVHRARRTIDSPIDQIYAGICSGQRNDGSECTVDLYAAPGEHFVTCPRCGTHHNLDRRRDTLRAALHDAIATAREIASGLGEIAGHPINVKTIRTWHNRRRLIPHGINAAGVPTYRIGDVLDLAAAMPDRTERKPA